uniref:ORF56 n=1 Tax=Malaco herpesvirus 4 TaxID=3031800 RepID=A0AA48P7P6_9VIRU|nr:TPA_asm: ORF56 [Malaco herpesvirus 4]
MDTQRHQIDITCGAEVFSVLHPDTRIKTLRKLLQTHHRPSGKKNENNNVYLRHPTVKSIKCQEYAFQASSSAFSQYGSTMHTHVMRLGQYIIVGVLLDLLTQLYPNTVTLRLPKQTDFGANEGGESKIPEQKYTEMYKASMVNAFRRQFMDSITMDGGKHVERISNKLTFDFDKAMRWHLALGVIPFHDNTFSDVVVPETGVDRQTRMSFEHKTIWSTTIDPRISAEQVLRNRDNQLDIEKYLVMIRCCLGMNTHGKQVKQPTVGDVVSSTIGTGDLIVTYYRGRHNASNFKGDNNYKLGTFHIRNDDDGDDEELINATWARGSANGCRYNSCNDSDHDDDDGDEGHNNARATTTDVFFKPSSLVNEMIRGEIQYAFAQRVQTEQVLFNMQQTTMVVNSIVHDPISDSRNSGCGENDGKPTKTTNDMTESKTSLEEELNKLEGILFKTDAKLPIDVRRNMMNEPGLMALGENVGMLDKVLGIAQKDADENKEESIDDRLRVLRVAADHITNGGIRNPDDVVNSMSSTVLAGTHPGGVTSTSDALRQQSSYGRIARDIPTIISSPDDSSRIIKKTLHEEELSRNLKLSHKQLALCVVKSNAMQKEIQIMDRTIRHAKFMVQVAKISADHDEKRLKKAGKEQEQLKKAINDRDAVIKRLKTFVRQMFDKAKLTQAERDRYFNMLSSSIHNSGNSNSYALGTGREIDHDNKDVTMVLDSLLRIIGMDKTDRGQVKISENNSKLTTFVAIDNPKLSPKAVEDLLKTLHIICLPMFDKVQNKDILDKYNSWLPERWMYDRFIKPGMENVNSMAKPSNIIMDTPELRIIDVNPIMLDQEKQRQRRIDLASAGKQDMQDGPTMSALYLPTDSRNHGDAMNDVSRSVNKKFMNVQFPKTSNIDSIVSMLRNRWVEKISEEFMLSTHDISNTGIKMDPYLSKQSFMKYVFDYLRYKLQHCSTFDAYEECSEICAQVEQRYQKNTNTQVTILDNAVETFFQNKIMVVCDI